jgi:hypothetical protein
MTNPTTEQLSTSAIAAQATALITILNDRQKVAPRDQPNDWSLFHLLKAMASFDDAVLDTFEAHCSDMGVNENGDKLDDDGEPVFDDPRNMNGYHDFVGSRI